MIVRRLFFSSEVSSGQYLAICQRKKSHDTTIRVSEVLSGQYRYYLGEKRKKCVCHCTAARDYCWSVTESWLKQ